MYRWYVWSMLMVLGALTLPMLLALGNFILPHTQFGLPRELEVLLQLSFIGWILYAIRIRDLIIAITRDFNHYRWERTRFDLDSLNHRGDLS